VRQQEKEEFLGLGVAPVGEGQQALAEVDAGGAEGVEA
jgi:hypothetical protein